MRVGRRFIRAERDSRFAYTLETEQACCGIVGNIYYNGAKSHSIPRCLGASHRGPSSAERRIDKTPEMRDILARALHRISKMQINM